MLLHIKQHSQSDSFSAVVQKNSENQVSNSASSGEQQWFGVWEVQVVVIRNVVVSFAMSMQCYGH